MRQMAAAASKKSTTSLSLFMEAYGLEVEERTLHLGHPVLDRRSLGRQVVYRTKRSMDEADL